jgi:hypothetical protein
MPTEGADPGATVRACSTGGTDPGAAVGKQWKGLLFDTIVVGPCPQTPSESFSGHDIAATPTYRVGIALAPLRDSIIVGPVPMSQGVY